MVCMCSISVCKSFDSNPTHSLTRLAVNLNSISIIMSKFVRIPLIFTILCVVFSLGGEGETENLEARDVALDILKGMQSIAVTYQNESNELQAIFDAE